MEQCLNSMKYLSKVMEEALKYTPEKAMEQIRERIERKEGKCS